MFGGRSRLFCVCIKMRTWENWAIVRFKCECDIVYLSPQKCVYICNSITKSTILLFNAVFYLNEIHFIWFGLIRVVCWTKLEMKSSPCYKITRMHRITFEFCNGNSIRCSHHIALFEYKISVIRWLIFKVSFWMTRASVDRLFCYCRNSKFDKPNLFICSILFVHRFCPNKFNTPFNQNCINKL